MVRLNGSGLWKTLLVFLVIFCPGKSFSETLEDPIGKRFNGEVLKYDIGFWLFSRVGEGEARFQSLGHGRYSAYHEGKTLGFVRWITRNRRDIYRSTMGTINDGKRLIPLRFEEDVIIGEKIRKRITKYDYSARKVFIETQKEGKSSREESDIPFGVVYDDPMTAFYNFRFGVYGKVEPGKEFSITTAPREGHQKVIRLIVASGEEAGKRRALEEEKGGKDLFITVHLDKELVGSLQGLVETWFNADVVPKSGVAKDVFSWGDLTGHLTSQGSLKGPGKSDSPTGKK